MIETPIKFTATFRRLIIITGLVLIHATVVNAEDARNLEIQVVGETPADIKAIPGAAAIITSEEIKEKQAQSLNELLQSVSGITVTEEDGMGLRQNISIRGVIGDRSRKVLLLEDGIPISLAPYGENSAYYSPEVDRIDRIEIRKGSGSIAYGPQTIGGIINYITPKAPETPEQRIRVTGGSNNYKALKYSFGGTFNDTGLYTSVLHKQGDGPRDPMPFTITDITAKSNTVLNPTNELSLKFHYYNEDAKVSYQGLSEAQYARDHTENEAIHDSLYVERLALSATHGYYGFANAELTTNAYAYMIRRDWWRADTNGLDADGNKLFLDSNGGRNRVYKVIGIEPRLSIGQWETGLKAHYETERNQRINGNSADARTPRKGLAGNDGLRDDEVRDTLAVSGFGQYDYQATDKLTITPGARIEAFQQSRHIFMNRSILNVVNGVDETVPVKTKAELVTEFIPGVGFTYDHSSKINVFGGVHRGFAPPRFSDAIDNDGDDQKLDSERSWNYEVGVRTALTSWLQANATAFYYDYQNQVISGSESGGITKFNAGESTSTGLEIELAATHKLTDALTLKATTAVTYVDSKFDGNIVDGEGNTIQTDGKRIPYVPKGTLSAGIGLNSNAGWGVRLDGLYITRQFSDAENTFATTADGESGVVPSYTVYNLSSTYDVNESWTVFGSIKNLFDTKYFTSRNPHGIMPGVERTIALGVEKKF